ncbi:MAG: hypothetical protein D6722_00275 [Bacteroidetes bacterium]|nr:MAG: hypothetical protein D6722_00275 [Bacteroidota bacterium]
MRISFLLFLMPLWVLMACSPETDGQQGQNRAEAARSQAEIDEGLILEWLNAEGLEAEATPSGIYYVIENPGGEEKPSLSSQVTVFYRGTNLAGAQFDGTTGEPVTFPLARLIRGWQEGIPLVGRGGKVKLIIPSGLAYGPQALTPEVGPNSVLVFDIELVDFQ